MFDMKNVTNTGIQFPKSLSEDEYMAAGETLAQIDAGMAWAKGDWWNANRWGDKAAAAERAGLDPDACKQYGYVASQFQMSMRIDILTFTHHAEIASVDEPLRSKLLERAAAERLSVAKLRKLKQAALGMVPEKKLVPASTDAKEWDEIVGRLSAKSQERLEALFVKQVMKAVRHELKNERNQLNERERALEERSRLLTKIEAGINSFMSDKEFKLVLSCLHPDRECETDRKQQAFVIFKRLEQTKVRVQ